MLRSFFLFLMPSLITFSHPPLSPSKRINGIYTKQALHENTINTFASVFKILEEDEHVSSGIVINEKGILLTKLSEYPQDALVQLNNGQIHSPTIISKDEESDLILLKINSTKLQPIDLSPRNPIEQADWLISVLPDNQTKVGICSAKQRDILKVSGVLGVLLGVGGSQGITVNQAINDGPAHLSGIKSGDIIQKINDHQTLDRKAVLSALQGHGPGKNIDVKILRNGQLLTKSITLGDRHVTFGMFNRNLEMSGTISKRVDGFKNIIQHDAAIGHNETGTPICNIEGKVIGINISRVNRSETYALPNQQVEFAIKRMREKLDHTNLTKKTAKNLSFNELIQVQSNIKKLLPKSQKVTVGLLVSGASGSGVLVSEDGYILTAAHISEAPKNHVKVFLDNGKVYDAVSLGIHPKADLGLIKIINTDNTKFPFVNLAKSQLHQAEDWCFALGHPNGFSLERGAVVRIGKLINVRPHLLWTDCTLVGGDSGGPLFNLQGEVIGINSLIFDSSE
ncbi:MAG: trypsin-like peptidase domain-containing protein [Lentisphaerales bacterium]|nr:trypsin-like peptidase domain-containing protein [Lentisphaerales bacterium]